MALFQSYSHRKFVNEKHIGCSKLFVLVNVKVRSRGRHHVLIHRDYRQRTVFQSVLYCLMLFAHHLLWSVTVSILALYKWLQHGFRQQLHALVNVSSHAGLHVAGAGSTRCVWSSRCWQCCNSSRWGGMCSHWSSLHFWGNRICEISQVFLSESVKFGTWNQLLIQRPTHFSYHLVASCWV